MNGDLSRHELVSLLAGETTAEQLAQHHGISLAAVGGVVHCTVANPQDVTASTFRVFSFVAVGPRRAPRRRLRELSAEVDC